jgi:hypothetical protein
MPFTSVLPGSKAYPELRLRWAPTTQPTDSAQTYVDITDRLRDWSWGYGRNDELARFEAGSGHVVLDNSDRYLDPSFNAGPWYGNIKPRRMFELVARWAGVEYPVFVAYARGFPQSWPGGGKDAVVRIDLVDAFALLQGVDLVVGFTRAAETSGERIAAVLDTISVPAALRDLDDGSVAVASIDVTSPGTSGLDHAKAVAIDTEGGQLFVAKDGKVTFHDYLRRLNAASLWTFTDRPGAPLAYGADFAPDFDEAYLWNFIRATGADGDDTAHTAEDASSQDDYHTLTKTLATQLISGSEIQQLADRFALRYAQPDLRAPQMAVSGAGNPAARWPVLLDLEISDRITVRRFADSADPMELVQNVEGIRHACRPGGPWVTTIVTSPADTRSYFTADHATLGLADASNYSA